jgi:hypothetical protein
MPPLAPWEPMGIAAQSTEAKGLVLVETKMDGYPRALTLFTLLSKQALSPSPTNSGNQRGLNANELARLTPLYPWGVYG